MNVNQNFVLRHIYGKHILMPIRKNEISGDPILLNDVAACIWESVSRQADRETVIKEITEHYSLTEGSAEQLSIENFLNHMLHINFIEEEEVCQHG